MSRTASSLKRLMNACASFLVRLAANTDPSPKTAHTVVHRACLMSSIVDRLSLIVKRQSTLDRLRF